MDTFTILDGLAAPLPRADVNTDDIIPARYLKSIRRTGFGPALFGNWRYLADGATPNPAFVLNRPEYQGAAVLLAGENFGCGSSREHAPWALKEYGFRCIIAPSFADIFYNNCFNNGILPITLPADQVGSLSMLAETPGCVLRIDLPNQSVRTPGGSSSQFTVDPFRKSALLQGQDNIDWILTHSDSISDYEGRRRVEAPWLFPEFAG